MHRPTRHLFILALLVIFFSAGPARAAIDNGIDQGAKQQVINDLTKKYGDSQKARMQRGVDQVAALWTKDDGSVADFQKFCSENFLDTPAKVETTFKRLEMFEETISGYFHEINMDLRLPTDLDWGEMLPIDTLMGQYDAGAHLSDDLFQNKVAFIVLLNFPTYSLAEKLQNGPKWTRQEWAFARLGDLFTSRVPAKLLQDISTAQTVADTYISEYNIFMGNLVDDSNKSYFPKDLKLISHWGLRDELKSHYADKDADGIKKQEMIYQVMQRIIAQEIPQEFINSDASNWNPFQNTLTKAGQAIPFHPEPDTRYARFLDVFKAMKALDPYYPTLPSHMQRMFEEEREMPEAQVTKMFTDFCAAPEVRATAKLISKRLNRPLRPFDLWYTGFTSKQAIAGAELDRIVAEKYKTLDDYSKDLPNILMKLGFSQEQANFIAPKIQVDPARGAGHCAGAEIKSAKARLRTRVPQNGMNYKGFNIAMHELGHAVEQTLTLHKIDYYALRGVPNVAFTEAFAFLFQARDLAVLGIKNENKDASYLQALDNLWSSYEIMGVALVDMKTWNWLYAHPNATPAELKEAVIANAKEIWNSYYADIFGVKDQLILGIYSHMIASALYLPDYPIGHTIQFQMERYMEGKNLGAEMERICKAGRIIPDLWMQNAVGSAVSTKPLLQATEEALRFVTK